MGKRAAMIPKIQKIVLPLADVEIIKCRLSKKTAK